jgi:hypothetical protein
MLFVRNNSGSDFSDRFDGIDYHFPNGELVECPELAANHIFGYGAPDKTQHMIRLGWAANSTTLKEAYERLDKFEFLQGRMTVDEPIEERPPVVKPEAEEEETSSEPREVASNLLSKMAQLAG